MSDTPAQGIAASDIKNGLLRAPELPARLRQPPTLPPLASRHTPVAPAPAQVPERMDGGCDFGTYGRFRARNAQVRLRSRGATRLPGRDTTGSQAGPPGRARGLSASASRFYSERSRLGFHVCSSWDEVGEP